MSLIPTLKSVVEKAPFPVGWATARIPYAVRPSVGPVYRQRTHEIQEYRASTGTERQRFVLSRLQAIVTHAYDNVPFYRSHYDEHGFHPSQLTSFADISRIPIVNKEVLQRCPIEQRSHVEPGRYLVNTGGSSGQPLSFYILPSSMGHEWAHMHHIWASLGYRQNDLKLAFSGRSTGTQAVRYDALRHHFAINTYAQWTDVASDLKRVLRRHAVRYLHGYPSAISDFASYCQSHDEELTLVLRSALKGAFLGSEFPAPAYRDRIHAVFGCPSVSWYGHTERAVLAWEAENHFEYRPFQSYGYAEVNDSHDNDQTLVATSYYNTASPLIRYDTEDGIEALEIQDDILSSFKVTGGRQGDYAIDLEGKRIPLTALVFGRHHRVFEYARFVQVKQSEPGHLVFLVTAEAGALDSRPLEDFFDLADIKMIFDFQLQDKPHTTPRGKVTLRVPDYPQD